MKTTNMKIKMFNYKERELINIEIHIFNSYDLNISYIWLQQLEFHKIVIVQ